MREGSERAGGERGAGALSATGEGRRLPGGALCGPGTSEKNSDRVAFYRFLPRTVDPWGLPITGQLRRDPFDRGFPGLSAMIASRSSWTSGTEDLMLR